MQVNSGDRVRLIEAPDIVGIARSIPRGSDDIVTVYWGTQDAREFIGNVPARLLERCDSDDKR